jgi:multicomponent Na+:H+ antiporter subunit F
MNVIEHITLWLFVASLTATAYRLFKGPTVPDRVVAIDLLAAILMVSFMWLAWVHDESAYMGVALAIAIVGFMATVAIAVYLGKGGRS